jgi:hypothetical protein
VRDEATKQCADEESTDREQGGPPDEARGATEGERQEHHVAGHVRDKYAAQFEIAEGIHQSGHHGHRHQEYGQGAMWVLYGPGVKNRTSWRRPRGVIDAVPVGARNRWRYGCRR